MATKHNVKDGWNDDDGGDHLLVVLRLGGQHDQVLGATHAVTSIEEALLPGDGQRVVDALRKSRDVTNIYDVLIVEDLHLGDVEEPSLVEVDPEPEVLAAFEGARLQACVVPSQLKIRLQL